jgi:hypothetical protein
VFILVADTPVVAGELVRRGPMNFGQDIPGWLAVPYCLHVSTGRLVAALQPAYDQFLREALDDAGNFPQDWPELAPVIAAGCPPLTELPTRLPKFLAQILRESMDMDLLDALLPLQADTPVRYLANTVDHVAVDHRWVAVCGQAFQVPDAPQHT